MSAKIKKNKITHKQHKCMKTQKGKKQQQNYMKNSEKEKQKVQL